MLLLQMLYFGFIPIMVRSTSQNHNMEHDHNADKVLYGGAVATKQHESKPLFLSKFNCQNQLTAHDSKSLFMLIYHQFQLLKVI